MKNSSILITLLLILPSALLAQGNADLARTLETKQQELDKLSQRVGAIDQQAKATGFVKAKLERFRDAVTKAILSEAPEMKDAVRRQDVLVEELTQGGLSERIRERKMAEYRELRAQIGPVEQSVNGDESVKEARQIYVDAIDSEREKINSNAEELFARQRKLAAEVKELKAQLAEG